jgi:hypothetical protein
MNLQVVQPTLSALAIPFGFTPTRVAPIAAAKSCIPVTDNDVRRMPSSPNWRSAGEEQGI